MRRLFVCLLAGALVVGARGGAVSAGGVWLLFAAAEDEDRLVAVELHGRRVAARIPVADGPHNVASNLRWVLVTSPPAGRVTLVDVYRLRVAKVFRGFGYPHDVEISRDGRHAYVTDERRGRVAVVSIERRRVVRSVRVPAGPHDLAVSPDGRRVWVTHGTGGSALTVLDTSRPPRARVLARVRAFGAPHDIAFGPGGRRVWVTYWRSSAVAAFDSRSGRLRLRVSVGRLPHHLAVGRHVWVTDHEGGRAFVLSPRTGRVVRRLDVGPSPHHVALAGGAAAVVSHDAGTVSVFRSSDGTRIGRPTHVGRGLHGVAFGLAP